MYRIHSLVLLGSICFLHLVTLSYGETPEEEEDPVPSRKRPILRKIIILVGLAIGLAALGWGIHKSYKAYCRWSKKRRHMAGRKELDDQLKDLEEQEEDPNTPGQSLGSTNGKYVPLNNPIPEEEPLMSPADGSTERAPQYVPENNSRSNNTGEASVPLLSTVPLDDSDPSGDQQLNMDEPSAPPPEEEGIQAV